MTDKSDKANQVIAHANAVFTRLDERKGAVRDAAQRERQRLNSDLFTRAKRALFVLVAISLVTIGIGLDTPIFWVILGLAVLFLVWLVNTALRQISRIRFDEEGLRTMPWPKKSIAWSGLEEMALRYYSTKRKRKDGWMTLTLKAGGNKIDIESTLPHFADIVARGFDPATVKRVIAMVDRNEYKRRQGPIGIKITPRAFGKDWRLPIVNRFRE